MVEEEVITTSQPKGVKARRDVTVDKRAKGSEPRSEFEVSPVKAPREKPGLNGEPVGATQNPPEDTPNG
jgi:hypothetical protein